MQPTKDPVVNLKIEQLNRNLELATKSLAEFQKLAAGSKELREWATNEITKYALSIRASKLDKDELENFFKYPYCILPGKHENEYYLAIPKFVDAQFGWLEKVTPSFNIFLVNRYVDWLGELPEALKKELKIQDPLEIYFDGTYLSGPDVKKAKEKYSSYIQKHLKDGRLEVDKSRHFELLANLIKDGILPFVPKEIRSEDLVSNRKCDFELRDYQKEAWEKLKKYSNIGAFFPPSTGKTFLGMYAATHLEGPWLVSVPSKLLIEQWLERIELYTDLVIGQDIDIATYQGSIKLARKKKYKGKIIDECHHLPANEFSKMAIIKTDYTLGLSATPQREDQREEYIFALTGFPVGLSWDKLKKLGIIQSPTMQVWIVKNEIDRIKRIESLLHEDLKTIIFCDSIELGKMVSKRFDLPHVFGDTKQRLSKIQDSQVAVVSRVGDEGVSLPDIQRVIEISWLHGSRRQELQRFTRLLHGKSTGEGHIIMTANEYQKDHKRLFGIMDKGFKIVLHREGISEKVIKQINDGPKPKRSTSRKIVVQSTQEPKIKVEMPNHPLLSLPGIQKQISTLRIMEKRFIKLLFERENDKFKTSNLCLLLGASSNSSFLHSVDVKKLIRMKLIKKVGAGTYQANLELLGLEQ